MVTKNVLRCDACGFEIITQAFTRDCAKCDNPMTFIRKEEVREKKEWKK